MKKILYVCAAVCAVFMMSSCNSKESAYKKAYEKAKAQQTVTTAPTTTPVQQVTTQTVTPVTTTPVADYSNVNVRNESVTFVEGSPLKQYGVVSPLRATAWPSCRSWPAKVTTAVSHRLK